jgi:hypothetical protein
MNNVNQENEELRGPVISTIPASLSAPGFGFLVALNTDWRSASREKKVNRLSSVLSRLLGCVRRATATRQKPSE